MRKVLFFILAAVIVSACAVYPRQRKVTTVFLDFTKYAEESFLISPDPYGGNYTSLGEISVTIVPGQIEVKKEPKSVSKGKKTFMDPIYGDYELKPKAPRNSQKFEPESIAPSEALDYLVEKAKAVGADAVVDFKFERISNAIGDYHYLLSGLCIQRL